MSTATVTGNIGRIEELRETNSGKKVVNFSVAETKRFHNKDTGQWEDGDTIWYNFTAWDRLAENLCAVDDNGNPLVSGGTHVIVLAHYVLKKGYTNKDGIEVGPQPQLIADDIAVSMKAFPATSPRIGGRGESKPAKKPATQRSAQKQAPKPAPKTQEDDFDNLFDDDDEDFFG